jgi:nicotinate-nucleotide pyrophosphorylase (carboxylating)
LIEYKQYRHIPEHYLRYKIAEFLYEDIPDGDKTSQGTVDDSELSTAIIEAQEDIVFAGEMILKIIYENHEIEFLAKDGDRVPNGGLIAKVKAPSGYLLSTERVLLNLIQRLSGIATMTAKYVDIASHYGVKILDTRKTTPGLRLFEKFAVTVGGGFNHRFDLSSGILIKDNHLFAAGGISKAVKAIKEKNFSLPIEVEVENFEQIKEALEAGVDGFLLDNMSPEITKEAVKMIRNFENGHDIFIESSGGINLSNLEHYVSTGVNAISSGALTHSVKSADIHIEFE